MTNSVDAQELSALGSFVSQHRQHPHLTHVAGGNASLKLGATLGIKASAT